MATIPIEVIIQDAESPVTPTPESGEETNITVPDTGTISDGGSNSGGIGSSASMILPAIVAVLAIGAMVALIIRRYQKRKKANTSTEEYNTKISRKEKLATAASGTIAILAATILVGNLVIPATNAATDGTTSNDEGELVVEDKITITVTREEDSDEAIVSSIENTSLATASYDFGYKVTASMAKGTTTANLYLDGNTDSPYYIAPVSDGILTDNTWGYTLSEPTEESSYLSIPLSTKPTNIVKEVAKTVEDTAVDIYYTVQIDKDMPNGTYTGELEYTISPAIEYMQDFSTLTSAEKTATLARMPEGKQYILKDNRDKNPYYISKLKDNNVWMTQNLDLDLISDPTAEGYVALTPANTNIKANWTPANSTIDISNGSFPGWGDNNNIPYSTDPGDVYYYTTGDDTDEQAIDKETCERNHEDGSCPHYHAGNYYNWSAAVAMNNTSEYGDDDQYVNVETSICPAGWRLPKNRNNAESVTEGNEQITEISSYDGILGEYSPYGPPGGYYSYLEGGFNAIRTAPLWLARSGEVSNGSLYNTGYGGFYWSSTVYSSDSAYALYLNPGYVSPAYYDNRDHGYSVRCIAQ